MGAPISRVMQTWIKSKGDDLAVDEGFVEVEHYMGITQWIADANNEVQTIRMQYSESVQNGAAANH